MEHDDTLYAKHILDAIALIESYLTRVAKEQFLASASKEKQDAVVRELEIIGEAARNLSEEARSRMPTIPWTEVRHMRDKLIHEYFGVDLEVVWQTATEDLPSLRAAVNSFLNSS